MANSIFVSYRRSDSQHAAFAIADRLRWAFGADEVFLDRGSIRAGNEWPESLRRGLDSAKALVLVIGAAWLRIADEWGRRRIDDPHDWVRREILTALAPRPAGRTEIIPVLLGGVARLRAEALDEPLRRVADFEPKTLDEDNWEDALESLLVSISETTGLQRLVAGDARNPNGSPARPMKVQTQRRSMTDAEVRQALQPLARWQLQWEPHPWGIGGRAQEISKSFDFASFTDVTTFMAESAAEIDAWAPPHHPRWENQWKVLNVSFTTWDVDCRVTELDIKAARKFDDLFLKWRPPSAR